MQVESPGFSSLDLAEYRNFLAGNIERVAPKQVDNFQDVNFNDTLDGYRVSFRYDEELGGEHSARNR
ncbi:hypothetical protein [Halarsenatibacter silvermanii]|uniref:Uncharacterized protein n=1 Tax=Halarsenatibacter silvermanii TaxID=321763 RepID=A0A1G9M3C1_9FIRM|nr:hypothetical protein [Halarsenatibacter silvermanii]SDL68461.1 hypothetical protein SAMN04488692_10787 [Halarsenatibacter silvermanii]